MTDNCNSIPVVFVHGRDSDSYVWNFMKCKFREAGYNDSLLFSWAYPQNNIHPSVNEELSPSFGRYINDLLIEKGVSKVDIVAHSFGSLITRWFIKFDGGSTKIRNWISIAGPNHGVDNLVSAGLALKEGYNIITDSRNDQGDVDMINSSYVIKQLNKGIETPGPTKYATISSTGDNPIVLRNSKHIVPIYSTKLDKAKNIVIYDESLGHSGLIRDERVSSLVLKVLRCEI